MCNDEARNVVIYSINTSIHVYVHEDLHEIYLLMLNLQLQKEGGGVNDDEVADE
jgi:hypothetical protein